MTFRTTTDAMTLEDAGKASGLSGRLIPVPRAITAGCGLAWSEPSVNRTALEQMIADQHLNYDQIVELVI